MLGRCTLEPPPTPPNFDAQNRAIRPISMRGSIGRDHASEAAAIRWWRMEDVCGVL